MDRLRGSTSNGSRIGMEGAARVVTNNGQRHDRRLRSIRDEKSLWMFMIVATVMLCGTPVGARDIAYCSGLNTGDTYDAMQSPYQSHGLCFDHCKGQDYAFAVLQDQSCWCSDYVPEGKKAECDLSCPGYPSEICGSTTNSAYAYLGTGKQPSGTTDGSTKTTVSSTSYTRPQISTVTTVNDAPTPTVTIVKSQKSSKSSTSSKTTTPNGLGSPTLSVITKVGGFQTITVSPTSTSDAASSETKSSQGNGLGPGGIAGLVIGLILLLVSTVVGILFWRHRRQRGLEAVYDSETPNSAVIPAGGAGILANGGGRRRSRSMSTLGLIGEKTNGSPTATQKPGPTAGGVTPISENGASSPTKPGAVYDPRLDPGQLFMRFDRETGSSRMSVRSLRDDTDYSRRVLRLANPDD